MDFFPEFGESGYRTEIFLAAWVGCNLFLFFIFYLNLKKNGVGRSISWYILRLVSYVISINILLFMLFVVVFFAANPNLI